MFDENLTMHQQKFVDLILVLFNSCLAAPEEILFFGFFYDIIYKNVLTTEGFENDNNGVVFYFTFRAYSL